MKCAFLLTFCFRTGGWKDLKAAVPIEATQGLPVFATLA